MRILGTVVNIRMVYNVCMVQNISTVLYVSAKLLMLSAVCLCKVAKHSSYLGMKKDIMHSVLYKHVAMTCLCLRSVYNRLILG